MLWLARIYRVQEEFECAEKLLLDTSVLKKEVIRVPEEIWTRAELALVYVQMGRCNLAEAQINCCYELMTGPSDDWRGLAGVFERATAVTRGAQGRADESEHSYKRAFGIFGRYRVRWAIAETLMMWSQQLISHSEYSSGLKRLNQGEQLYAEMGVAGHWLEKADALRGSIQTNEVQDAERLIAKRSISQLTGPFLQAPCYKLTADRPQDEICEYAKTRDVALIGTLIHDAIAHLMNAIHNTSKMRDLFDRLVIAVEAISNSLAKGPLTNRRQKRPSGRSGKHE